MREVLENRYYFNALNLSKSLEKLSAKEFNVPMYFMNSCIDILPAFCFLIVNKFSSKYNFISCFGIIESHSNNSEKYDISSDVLRNCLAAIV